MYDDDDDADDVNKNQQLLPGEIINNQSPISQAFKSIKHIMDTQAFGQGNDRNWVW